MFKIFLAFTLSVFFGLNTHASTISKDCTSNIAIIDGKVINTESALHDSLSEQLCFPAYYGKNLDALYDMLISVSQPTQINITNPMDLENALGKEKYQALILLLKEASMENSNLNFK